MKIKRFQWYLYSWECSEKDLMHSSKFVLFYACCFLINSKIYTNGIISMLVCFAFDWPVGRDSWPCGSWLRPITAVPCRYHLRLYDLRVFVFCRCVESEAVLKIFLPKPYHETHRIRLDSRRLLCGVACRNRLPPVCPECHSPFKSVKNMIVCLSIWYIFNIGV